MLCYEAAMRDNGAQMAGRSVVEGCVARDVLSARTSYAGGHSREDLGILVTINKCDSHLGAPSSVKKWLRCRPRRPATSTRLIPV